MKMIKTASGKNAVQLTQQDWIKIGEKAGWTRYCSIKTFTHPQESWDAQECAERAKSAPANAYGDRPPKGIIASSASTYPEYGQTIRFNGGTVINGEWYEAVSVPLPKIADGFEFATLTGWGTIIRATGTQIANAQK